jgi:hypothetical protein
MKPISKIIIDAVDYANNRYYSRPLSVLNLKKLVLPIIPIGKTKVLSIGDEKVYQLRISHGLPHAIAAMELIEAINEQYKKFVRNFDDNFGEIANKFNLSPEALLEFIQVAALFHDTGRKGDGLDLWDADSAIAAKNYFDRMINKINQTRTEQDQISLAISTVLAGAIEHKDDSAQFRNAFNKYHKDIDLIRQFINMADTLEVMRCRDDFNPNYLPIMGCIDDEAHKKAVIEDLVIPHRKRIFAEGRNSKKARIVNCFGYEDNPITMPEGSQGENLCNTIDQIFSKYHLHKLDKIDSDRSSDLFEDVLESIEHYLSQFKIAEVRVFNNGLFNPGFSGTKGKERAKYYQSKLIAAQTAEEKGLILYALIADSNSSQLKHEVLRRLGNYNQKAVLDKLGSFLKKEDNVTSFDKQIHEHIQAANQNYPDASLFVSFANLTMEWLQVALDLFIYSLSLIINPIASAMGFSGLQRGLNIFSTSSKTHSKVDLQETNQFNSNLISQ